MTTSQPIKALCWVGPHSLHYEAQCSMANGTEFRRWIDTLVSRLTHAFRGVRPWGDEVEALEAREIAVRKPQGHYLSYAQERSAVCEEVARTCFPPDPQGHHGPADRLRDYFTMQFCEAHTCDRAKQRPLPFGPLHGSQNWGWVVITAVVLSMLLFFYAITGCASVMCDVLSAIHAAA